MYRIAKNFQGLNFSWNTKSCCLVDKIFRNSALSYLLLVVLHDKIFRAKIFLGTPKSRNPQNFSHLQILGDVVNCFIVVARV